ncbi:helix-turn-helix domain-containing protein [Ureibacillus composti]|nr:helix-turn-helix domain-containing protein [Ureibacillus composti]
MRNKAEILMHPVRMKILQSLMQHKENGVTTFEMLESIQDVSQATLYRHIQILLDANIIKIVHERKVRAVTEKYYGLNEEEAHLDLEEWRNLSKEKKLNYISYYQLVLMTQYQNYLTSIEKNPKSEDSSTFSLVDLKLSEEQFSNFQNELNQLMIKYYKMSDDNADSPTKTVAINIIPKA